MIWAVYTSVILQRRYNKSKKFLHTGSPKMTGLVEIISLGVSCVELIIIIIIT